MEKKQNYSVVILSAGLSERMGQPKMFLKWGHLTFIENIVKGYEKFGCNEIIVVLNERDSGRFNRLKIANENLKIVINNHIDWGRFYSLKLGLSVLTRTDHCFINNVDSPFVNQKILFDLSCLVDSENYVVPLWNNTKGHPVLMSKKIIEDIINEHNCRLNMKEFLKDYDCKYCPADDEKILVNINTVEDYNNAIKKFQIKD